MKYGVSAQNLAARDEGFLVETEYYDYNEYRMLLEKKKREYSEYELGNIAYESLKYPLDPASYLTPLTKYKVGQLVYVRLHIITPEVRDRTAFESFIPAGSELVNTILSTETKATTEEKVFDREELRDDRYFAYKEVMESGEYIGSYVLRMTHAGTYSVLPSTAFEFDRNEVFGRSAGKVIEIKK